jgi:hypothetical protein
MITGTLNISIQGDDSRYTEYIDIYRSRVMIADTLNISIQGDTTEYIDPG